MKNCRRRKRARYLWRILVRIGLLLLVLYLLWILLVYIQSENSGDDAVCKAKTENTKPELEPEGGAKKPTLSTEDYPEELLQLLQKNPETEEFVLNYPAKKDYFSREVLKGLNQKEMPLLLQWDEKWGYYPYGDNVMGLTGCGPTCLSMVASFLLQNGELTPIYMADYATRNGYCVYGSGTSWEFMSKGAMELGLQVWEVPLEESRVTEYLRRGNPIICIMGAGVFTDNGHFIVLTGLENGKIKINDPNSRERSERLWEFAEIKSQIRNMWVYFKG